MINIVVPSMGRSDIVSTNIDGQILYVPESEYQEYKERNTCEIMFHKDDEYKNLAEKRQGIYDKFGDVFMVDDDIDFVSRVWHSGNNRATHLSSSEVTELINTTYINSKNAGCYLFGFAASPNSKHYHPQKPIKMNQYINACAFGIIKSEKLYFSNKTTAAESHWINLLNAYQNRKSWMDTRFHFAQKPNSTFFLKGGQTANRTIDSEKKDTLFLRRMFGQSVKLKSDKKDVKAVHKFQRTIKIPL